LTVFPTETPETRKLISSAAVAAELFADVSVAVPWLTWLVTVGTKTGVAGAATVKSWRTSRLSNASLRVLPPNLSLRLDRDTQLKTLLPKDLLMMFSYSSC